MLQERGGSRWVAIEVSRRKEKYVLPAQHLREAVKTSAFELVRSFPIEGSPVDRIDLYRFKLPVAEVQEVELPFPVLGPDVKYRVRPVPTRNSG